MSVLSARLAHLEEGLISENGVLEVLWHKKAAVKDLLLSRAYAMSVVKYSEMYEIFEDEKAEGISHLTWRGCVWETVEDVCAEISSREGAIYYSLLSNRNGIPEDVFWTSFRTWRKDEYEGYFKKALPPESELSMGERVEMANFERSRVYRHARKYYQNINGAWRLK